MDDLEGVVACRGAERLLAEIPAAQWCLVTSSTRPLAEVRLRAAGLPLPQYFITSSDITRGKPDPEPYDKAAAMLGVAPQRCVVLEDTPAGIQSGKAAGCRVIALRTTMPDAVLRAASPDWIVDGCADVQVTRAPDGELELKLTS